MARRQSNIFSSLYFEYYAAAVLEDSIPELYSGIKHIGKDSTPDLMVFNQKNRIGIEVTTSFPDTEIDAYYDEYCGTPESKVPQKVMDALAKKGYSFYSPQGIVYSLIQNAYSFSNNPHVTTGEDLLLAIKKKTELLNKPHYKQFNSQELFILCDVRNMLEDVVRNIFSFQNDQEYDRCYDVIYLYSKNQLFRLRIKQGESSKIQVPHTWGYYYSLAFRQAYPDRV